MNNTHKKLKTKLKFIFFWIFLILSFSFFATLLILEANGLYFNAKNYSIQKTGLISLNGMPKNDIKFYLNDKLLKTSFPVRITKIFPGRYELLITKDGFYDWRQAWVINPNQAFENIKVVLFYKQPKIVSIDENKISLPRVQDKFKTQSTGINVKNESEIWIKENILTRFSGKITGAIITSDSFHIIFQENDELKVMDIDGTNINSLVKLTNIDPTSFYNAQNKLVYIDNGKVFEAQISE